MKVLHKIFLACLLFLLIVPVVQAEGTGGYSDLYGLTCRNNNENIYGAWTFIGATEFVGDVTFNKMTGDTIIVTILDVQKLDVDSIYMVDATGDDSTSWHDDGTYSTLHFDNPLKLTGASVLHGNSAASWSIYDSDLETGVSVDTAAIVIGGSYVPQINGYATDGNSSMIRWTTSDNMKFLNAADYEFDNGITLKEAAGHPAVFIMEADASQDNADTWRWVVQDGDLISLQSFASGSYVTKLSVVGSTGAMSAPGTFDQTIVTTAAGGDAGINLYISQTTTPLTGTLHGIKASARVNVESAAGDVTGGEFKAGNLDAGYSLNAVRGVYAEVVNKIPSGAVTWGYARGYEVNMDLDQGTSGNTNTITDAQMFYGVYNLPTAGSYVTVTNGYGIFLRNEAVGGTGQMLDAGFYLDDLSHTGGIKGWNYGIDFSGIGSNSGGFGTADFKLSNGALFYNSSAALLTITEATVDIDGASTASSYTSDADITARSTASGDIINDNSTVGSDANSGHIILRGNDGAADTERQMSVMLEVNTTTDYYWAWYNTGKGTEVGSIDESGNLQVDGAFTPGSVLLADDTDFAWGTNSDVLFKWSTNGAGDDLFVSRFDKADANASVAWFMSQDLDPSGMTDHADYLSPTLIMVNDEGADANDYAAVVIGERTNANVAATHYYDFYAMTGAVDGTPDPNITETGATFRFGSSGSITAVTATGAGDVLFENDIEVVGTMTLGHDAANTSGIIYFVASDNDLGNVAITTDDYLVFTDFTLVDVNGDFTAGTVASITAGNLVDKSATEAISGRWTFNDGTTFDDSLIIANIAAVVDFDSVLTLYTGADSPSDAFVEVVNSANYGRLSIGRTSGSESSILSIVDGGGDNKPGLLSLYDDGGGGNYLWISTANELYGHTSAPSDDDADGFPIMDFDTGAMGESGVAFGGLTITAAGNTFNLTQGTSSLDVASGKAVNIDQNLSITTEAITLDQSLATSDDVQFGAMTATGILSGMSNITLDTDPTIVLGAADCKNMVRINNDADVIDYTLPAAEAGLVVVFLDVAGAVITVDPFDGADTIYLNGASVGAGDAIDSPGAINDKIVLIALDATRWWVLSQEGAWVDGGAD